MEDRWIVLTTYADINEANEAARILKAAGIKYVIDWDSTEQTMWDLSDEEARWISLDVREEHYEKAAELLELEPQTVESFYEEQAYNEEVLEQRRKRGLVVWGSILTGVIILKVILELI